MNEPLRWTSGHPDGGRRETDGTVWFACDPYPTWYRWEDGEVITAYGRFNWADDLPLIQVGEVGLIARIEAVVRLLEPSDITPMGARQIRAILADEAGLA